MKQTFTEWRRARQAATIALINDKQQRGQKDHELFWKLGYYQALRDVAAWFSRHPKEQGQHRHRTV